MEKIIHPIPSLDPEVWVIVERNGHFTPRLNGRPLLHREGRGGIYWAHTLKAAIEAVYGFLGRMQ